MVRLTVWMEGGWGSWRDGGLDGGRWIELELGSSGPLSNRGLSPILGFGVQLITRLITTRTPTRTPHTILNMVIATRVHRITDSQITPGLLNLSIALSRARDAFFDSALSHTLRTFPSGTSNSLHILF